MMKLGQWIWILNGFLSSSIMQSDFYLLLLFHVVIDVSDSLYQEILFFKAKIHRHYICQVFL
jgi:hypothetical protein